MNDPKKRDKEFAPLDNPLPLPVKRPHRADDFDVPEDPNDDFDLSVAETDDFDLE